MRSAAKVWTLLFVLSEAVALVWAWWDYHHFPIVGVGRAAFDKRDTPGASAAYELFVVHLWFYILFGMPIFLLGRFLVGRLDTGEPQGSGQKER